MYLGSNKQNQIRYHGKDVGFDNSYNDENHFGAVSPNGLIMPDFSRMSPNAPKPASSSSSSSSFDFNKLLSFGTQIGSQALKNSFDLKIAKLNLANQQNYLAQQQNTRNMRDFQSFASQNPVATQGTDYTQPPPMYVNGGDNQQSSIGKYLPYILGGAGLLLVVMMNRGR